MSTTADHDGRQPSDARRPRDLGPRRGWVRDRHHRVHGDGAAAPGRRRRGVSIPTAGHLISAYALGVVVGAPVLAFLGARLPRRGLLIALMAAYAGRQRAQRPGRQLRAAAARPLPGRPPARRLLRRRLPGRRRTGARADVQGRAVAMVMLGLSVANVVGVPPPPGWASTSAGARRSGSPPPSPLLTVALVAFVRAVGPRRRRGTGRRELAPFTQPPGLAHPAGRRDRLRRHVRPLLLHRHGRHRGRWSRRGCVPVFLLAFGLGMVAGTYVAGAWPTGRSSAPCSRRSSAMAAPCLRVHSPRAGWWAPLRRLPDGGPRSVLVVTCSCA